MVFLANNATYLARSGKFGRRSKKTSKKRIKTSLLNQPPGSEEGLVISFWQFHDAHDDGHLVEGEVALRDGGEVAVQPAHHRAHHTVAKPAQMLFG